MYGDRALRVGIRNGRLAAEQEAQLWQHSWLLGRRHWFAVLRNSRCRNPSL
jgi:hypothetical protein